MLQSQEHEYDEVYSTIVVTAETRPLRKLSIQYLLTTSIQDTMQGISFAISTPPWITRAMSNDKR